MGHVNASVLEAAGIQTIDKIAKASETRIQKTLHDNGLTTGSDQIRAWIKEAKDITNRS
jgi:predicted flap endonuclease-1-like 5' DNA nuclease